MDNLTKEQRHRNMAAIKSKNTRPELIVRRFLKNLNHKFTIHRHTLPGKPDIFIGELKRAIFIHGCFWHRHPHCRYAATPKTNSRYWKEKFKGNQLRDKTNLSAIRKLGIKPVILWECEILNRGRKKNCGLQKLKKLSFLNEN